MRRVATAAIVVIATVVGAHNSARAQSTAPNIPLPPAARLGPTPLVWYGIGSVACAAVSPMIATVVLGRELTATDPMPYQTSGVGPRRAAGGNGILGAVDCARAELWAPTTVAITTIAAVATRRMGTPQPAADMGILHRV